MLFTAAYNINPHGLGLRILILHLIQKRAGCGMAERFFVDGVNIHGDKQPSGELVGDFQGIDGNEGARMTRLMEAWHEQSWGGGKVFPLGRYP